MALAFAILFSAYSVPCGQLLVTEADLSDPSRRARFTSSLRWLLDAGCVPVLINQFGKETATQYKFLLGGAAGTQPRRPPPPPAPPQIM